MLYYETFKHFFTVQHILEIIYFAKGRKNPKLIIDGFEFKFEKKKGNGTFWNCTFYQKTKCKCRLVTRANLVYLRHSHNHERKYIDIQNMSHKMVSVIRSC